ncbi:GNAT family N-acetyltransferase [Mumia qirimensis]|uniref:GNAT family N-acetyltransferase n=1 Tax=Mumia qirimensis TaxID=3234852 RepID=UPI00351CD9BE
MSAAAPVVRRRVADDVPALVDVLALVHERDRYPIMRTNVRAGWLTAPDGPAWTVELDGVVVGQAALQVGADPVSAAALGVDPAEALTLSRFFVSPAARGTGAAGALLDTVESYAARTERALALEAVAHSVAARALYAARGWTPLGSYEVRWFGDDGPAFDAYRFVLPARQRGLQRSDDVQRSDA